VKFTARIRLVPRLRLSGAVPSFLLYVCMPWTGTTLRYTLETQSHSKLATLTEQGEKGVSLRSDGYHSICLMLV